MTVGSTWNRQNWKGLTQESGMSRRGSRPACRVIQRLRGRRRGSKLVQRPHENQGLVTCSCQRPGGEAGRSHKGLARGNSV